MSLIRTVSRKYRQEKGISIKENLLHLDQQSEAFSVDFFMMRYIVTFCKHDFYDVPTLNAGLRRGPAARTKTY